MASSRLLAYILNILLSKIGPKYLKSIIWSKKSIKLSQRTIKDQGTIYLHPLICIAEGLIPYQIVEVLISYETRHGVKKHAERFMKLDLKTSPGLSAQIGKNDFYNLFGREPVRNIIIDAIKSYRCIPKVFKVLVKADNIKLAAIKQIGLNEDNNYSDALHEMLKIPRIVYRNDALSISVSDVFTGKTSLRYFKVDCLDSPCVVCTRTSVYQIASVNTYLPYSAQQICVKLPSQMTSLVTRMADLKIAHESVAEDPLVLLLTGSAGSGKRLIVSQFAVATHQNLLESSCFDLWSEVSAQGETKLRNIFEKAKSYQPCVLHLTSIDVLGLDISSNVIDNRIISTLRSLLTEHSQLSVVLSCRSDQVSQLSSAIHSQVLYDFAIDRLNKDDRSEFFSSRIPHSAVKFAARNTSGFVIAELFDVIRDSMFRASVKSLRSISIEELEWAIDKRNARFADAIGAPKIPSVSWEDVGGLEETKQLVIESIEANLNSSNSLKRSGIILFGPPGCGKTLIAKAVATEFKIAFLSVKGPELLNKYVGQSEENLRKVFDRARQASPCVVFFDELDSLAPNRGLHGDSGGVMDRIVSQLLSEMDSLHQSSYLKVFVMAATNRADLIDPSLLTPGRFDKVINVYPGRDIESKIKILEAVSRGVRLSNDVKLDVIASHCDNIMSGADLYSLVASAAMEAVREQVHLIESGLTTLDRAEVTVTSKHFNIALKKSRKDVSIF